MAAANAVGLFQKRTLYTADNNEPVFLTRQKCAFWKSSRSRVAITGFNDDENFEKVKQSYNK